jgi:hypothetical protein
MKRRHDEERSHLESPLGLADEPIQQSPEDHLPAGDHASRKRRLRALGEDGLDHQSSGLGDLNTEHDGATGIDMGYGGSGTDVKSGS